MTGIDRSGRRFGCPRDGGAIERCNGEFSAVKNMNRLACNFRTRGLRWRQVWIRGVHLAAGEVRHRPQGSAVLHHLLAAFMLGCRRKAGQAR